MRLTGIRAILAVMLAAGLATAPVGCGKADEGALTVLVIGEAPNLADPADGPLAPPDAVLINNVAQGLVRFDARGDIEPALAETWNVSDDGLSYIFRLANTEWENGERVTARQVARLLRQSMTSRRNPIGDTLGAVEEIVAMTDRVLEIRLAAPRPNLLELLAQPEFGLVRNATGTGPFRLADERGPAGALRLTRMVPVPDEEAEREDEVMLSGAAVQDAVKQFAEDEVELVLGGTFADLPYARRAQLGRNALQFDPVAGLFGLVPARTDGPLADVEFRRLLAQAIDRAALITSFDVPGLLPRATVLEANLAGVPDPTPPPWTAVPVADRRAQLSAEANRIFGNEDRPTLRIALPEGPGADILLARLAADWAALGISVEKAPSRRSADLVLVDLVAPSTSPAWFLRQFRCGQAAICSEEVDELLDAARAAPVALQRGALLAEAALTIDEQQFFLPIAAPIRWSLVSDRAPGFAGNRFAVHTLTSLGIRLDRERAD